MEKTKRANVTPGTEMTNSSAGAAGRPAAIGRTVTMAAIVLFVAITGLMLFGIANPLMSTNAHLALALMLDLALILIGWRRSEGDAGAVRHDGGEARNAALTTTDALTGFLNRRALIEEAATTLIVAGRRGKSLAMLMIDVDHLKEINDTHGRAVGDALLRQIAAAITDALPSVSLTARLGGDEFACAFLFDPQHPEPVDSVADRLIHRLTEPFSVEGLDLLVSASIGIARSDSHGPGFDTIMRCAEMATAAAKTAGANRAAWFDQSMERALQARNDLETSLRAAIPRQEIVPYFEKQVDLKTGRLVGFEVLARWEHKGLGLVPPDQFIPIAERMGIIGEMSLAIMRQAFIAASDWDPSLGLSVNISPVQIKDPWLAQKIIKVLTETGFPAARLEVEITEKALFDNLALAQSIIASLKNQGIRVALDDFGTGFSSLAHLRALPFDQIKIDRSFVMSINDNAESAAIANAVARLGDSLNLPITAEGIENGAIEDRMRAMGCAKGQGYHYGRPMSANNTRRLLAEKRLLVSGAPARGHVYPISEPDRRAAG